MISVYVPVMNQDYMLGRLNSSTPCIICKICNSPEPHVHVDDNPIYEMTSTSDLAEILAGCIDALSWGPCRFVAVLIRSWPSFANIGYLIMMSATDWAASLLESQGHFATSDCSCTFPTHHGFKFFSVSGHFMEWSILTQNTGFTVLRRRRATWESFNLLYMILKS